MSNAKVGFTPPFAKRKSAEFEFKIAFVLKFKAFALLVALKSLANLAFKFLSF